MEILVRKKDEEKGKWTKVKEKQYQNESALQHLLYRSPEMIPIEKLGEDVLKPRLFIKEAGLPGSGNTDLIGIDEEGGITIIECKLATNYEIRRKVIGQVFEYAAYLWQKTYEEFDRICCRAEKWDDRHLADVIKAMVEDHSEGWSEADFVSNVGATLETGDFRLIIAVDAMNDELKRIIQFLNSRGEDTPKIYALEMRQFESAELSLQMIVPELFGFTPHRTTSGIRPSSDKDSFFQDAKDRFRDRQDVVEAMEDIYRFSEENAAFIGWGTGANRRSFIFHGVRKGLSIFTLRSDGTIDNNVGWPESWKKPNYASIGDLWISTLNKTLEISLSKGGGIISNIADLLDKNKLSQFKEAVLFLCSRIKEIDNK